MKFITSSSGRLVELSQWQQFAASSAIRTGIAGLDELYGSGGIVRGAVHELLHPSRGTKPMFPTMLLARAAANLTDTQPPAQTGTFLAGVIGWKASADALEPGGVIVISDPAKKLYPPAAAQLGIPLSRLYLLHPANRQQELWAIGECLASAGVSAVVASLSSLTQVEARRLQLAAERGGGVGLFMRPVGKVSDIYSAASRLLVTPAPASQTSQRWNLQLLHGRGNVGTSIVLEYNREDHTVHTSAQLADRPATAPAKSRNRVTA